MTRASALRRIAWGRLALGAAGVATMTYGITRLWFGHQVGDPVHVAEWLLGAIIIHDLGIAPLVIATGYVLTRVLPGWARGIVQGGLLVAGAVLVITIPPLIKPVPSIPTVLPLDYARNLAIVLGAIAFGTASLIALRAWRRHSTTPPTDTNPPPQNPPPA